MNLTEASEYLTEEQKTKLAKLQGENLNRISQLIDEIIELIDEQNKLTDEQEYYHILQDVIAISNREKEWRVKALLNQVSVFLKEQGVFEELTLT